MTFDEFLVVNSLQWDSENNRYFRVNDAEAPFLNADDVMALAWDTPGKPGYQYNFIGSDGASYEVPTTRWLNESGGLDVISAKLGAQIPIAIGNGAAVSEWGDVGLRSDIEIAYNASLPQYQDSGFFNALGPFIVFLPALMVIGGSAIASGIDATVDSLIDTVKNLYSVIDTASDIAASTNDITAVADAIEAAESAQTMVDELMIVTEDLVEAVEAVEALETVAVSVETIETVTTSVEVLEATVSTATEVAATTATATQAAAVSAIVAETGLTMSEALALLKSAGGIVGTALTLYRAGQHTGMPSAPINPATGRPYTAVELARGGLAPVDIGQAKADTGILLPILALLGATLITRG